MYFYIRKRDAGNIADDLIVKEEICRVVIIFKMLNKKLYKRIISQEDIKRGN